MRSKQSGNQEPREAEYVSSIEILFDFAAPMPYSAHEHSAIEQGATVN